MSRKKPKKIKYEIATVDGPETIEGEALDFQIPRGGIVCGYWAVKIEKSAPFVDGEIPSRERLVRDISHRVTHLPSGRSIGAFPSRRKARDAARALTIDPGFDHTSKNPDGSACDPDMIALVRSLQGDHTARAAVSESEAEETPIPEIAIDRVVGWIHVSKSADHVREQILEWLGEISGELAPRYVEKCTEYAVKQHARNRDHYQRVMGDCKGPPAQTTDQTRTSYTEH